MTLTSITSGLRTLSRRIREYAEPVMADSTPDQIDRFVVVLRDTPTEQFELTAEPEPPSFSTTRGFDPIQTWARIRRDAATQQPHLEPARIADEIGPVPAGPPTWAGFTREYRTLTSEALRAEAA